MCVCVCVCSEVLLLQAEPEAWFLNDPGLDSSSVSLTSADSPHC